MTVLFPRVIVFDLDGTIWTPDMYELWGGGGAPFRHVPGQDDRKHDRRGHPVRLLGQSMDVLSSLHHWQGAYPGPSTTDDAGIPFLVAAASTCDEPAWARELLGMFRLRNVAQQQHPKADDGALFEELFAGFDDIYGGNKRGHMTNILAKAKQRLFCTHSVVPPVLSHAAPDTASAADTVIGGPPPRVDGHAKPAAAPPVTFDDFIFFDNQMNNIRDVSQLGICCVYCPDGITKEAWEGGLRQWREHRLRGPQNGSMRK